MKENVITNVLSIMMGELNQEQYEKLKDAYEFHYSIMI